MSRRRAPTHYRSDLHATRLRHGVRKTAENRHFYELLFLVSGNTAIVLDDGKTRRKVSMKAGEALIVPRGVWHTFEIAEPGDLLAITRGAGTEIRDD
jgi:mannose-6-phosphate isomerase-like protein (cupin superfamily)